MRISLVLFTFVALWGACQPSSTQQAQKEKPKIVADEDDLLARLSMQFIPNPRSQAQKDQNEIISHAIGELLDVQSTASGLYYVILDKGDQEDIPPRSGDFIYVQYKGTFLDGKVFDQATSDQPLKVTLRQVIPGWQEALPLLRKGGSGIFLVPSHLAYGDKGFGKHIPPNKVLRFELKIMDIERY